MMNNHDEMNSFITSLTRMYKYRRSVLNRSLSRAGIRHQICDGIRHERSSWKYKAMAMVAIIIIGWLVSKILI